MSATGTLGTHLLDLRVMSMSDSGDPFRVSAFRCTIAPFVRTYSAEMTGSVLSETFLSSVTMGFNLIFMDDQARGLIPPLFRLATSRVLRNGREEPCEPCQTENLGLVKVAKANVDAAPESLTEDSPEIAWYPKDCI